MPDWADRLNKNLRERGLVLEHKWLAPFKIEFQDSGERKGFEYMEWSDGAVPVRNDDGKWTKRFLVLKKALAPDRSVVGDITPPKAGPVTPLILPDPAESGSSKTPLIVAGAILGVLVVAGGIFAATRSSTPTSAIANPAAPAVQPVVPSPAPAAGGGGGPVQPPAKPDATTTAPPPKPDPLHATGPLEPLLTPTGLAGVDCGTGTVTIVTLNKDLLTVDGTKVTFDGGKGSIQMSGTGTVDVKPDTVTFHAVVLTGSGPSAGTTSTITGAVPCDKK